MSLLLGLETSTTVCSVAISKNRQLLAELNYDGSYAHSEKLAVFIEKCLNEAQVNIQDIDAVVISEGPGSYTGLRIGCSLAKGICFAQNIPLISINTLKLLAYSAIKNSPNFDYYYPMLDARRMEVYTACFDKNLNPISPTQSLILDNVDLQQYFPNQKIVLTGNGAVKCYELIKEIKNVELIDVKLNACDLNELGLLKYRNKAFCDLAYFEPFYLKPFFYQKKNQ